MKKKGAFIILLLFVELFCYSQTIPLAGKYSNNRQKRLIESLTLSNDSTFSYSIYISRAEVTESFSGSWRLSKNKIQLFLVGESRSYCIYKLKVKDSSICIKPRYLYGIRKIIPNGKRYLFKE